MLVVEACADFARHCLQDRQLSEHTLAAYLQDLKDYGRKDGKMKIGDVRGANLTGYVTYLRNARGLAPATVKRRIACIRVMYKWLKRRRLITEDPFVEAELSIRIPERLPRCLSTSEAKKLAKAARDASPETRLAIFVLFVTGIRVGELVRLCRGDVDIDKGTMRVQGKGNRQRIVFLPDDYTKNLMRNYLAARKSKAPNACLLIGKHDQPLRTAAVRSRLKRLAEEAGLNQKVTPHVLRHTAATALLEAGVDIRFVQRLLGHQSILTTQIYAHVRDEALRSAIVRADVLDKMNLRA